jgi:nitrite reductase/ring-hydroxylating ferredoxin subunit
VSCRPGEEPGSLDFESGSLRVGEVRPITADYCVARTEEGVVAFARRCPHEGSDLAAGYLEGSRIHCPGHDLAIDLRTGRSPCRSLAAIDIPAAVERDNTVTVFSKPGVAV